jgi:hypothetical protein
MSQQERSSEGQEVSPQAAVAGLETIPPVVAPARVRRFSPVTPADEVKAPSAKVVEVDTTALPDPEEILRSPSQQ